MNVLRGVLSEVRGAALVGIGDNVLDCYMFEELAYPGGNALNVAAYTRLLLGGDSAFIGIVGQDRFGDHLMSVLEHIGVDGAHCRRAVGPTGLAFVELDDDGDRVFTASNRGGVQQQLRIRFNDADLDYVAGFDRVHTSTYSGLDADLPRISEVVPVSYDFSDDADNLLELAPLVELSFVSGGHLSDAQVDDLGKAVMSAGGRHLVVTLGQRGSVAFTGRGKTIGPTFDVDVVDALGAGDAFIAGYLSAYNAGCETERCLEAAAAAGAMACTLRGAFGYPTLAGSDARAQMEVSLAAHRQRVRP